MKQKTIYGIVQGRLIQSPKGELQWFPQKQWEKEFSLAADLGFSYIELIVEREHNPKNPVWDDDGIKKIKKLVLENKLILHAICTDYIINHNITKNRDVVEHVLNLIHQSKRLGVEKLILPLFEESELNEKNSKNYRDLLIEIADEAEKNKIKICLETILNGKQLISLFKDLNHKNISCVFDTGNRIAFGHNIYEDIKLLDKHIQHVHIKDKNMKNENVLLGTGNVNFLEVFRSLKAINYNGSYTFETHRGSNPIKTATYNMMLTNYFKDEAELK